MKTSKVTFVMFLMLQLVVAGFALSEGRRRAGAPPKSDGQVEVEGTITAASATSITIHDSHAANVVIALTSATVIRKGDVTAAAADLKVGDQVHVKVATVSGVVTATQVLVQAEDTKHEPEAAEIEGSLTAASKTSITVHSARGTDTVVALTSTTVIRKGDATIAAADLKVGDQVHVQAVSANGVNTATLVLVQREVEDEHHPLEVSGTITAVSAASITVHDAQGNNVILMLTANTIIRKGDASVAATDLKTGDKVEVAAVAQGTVNTAIAIHVEAPEPAEDAKPGLVSGPVTAVSGTALTVRRDNGSVIVKTDASTVIKKKGSTVALSDVHVGDTVTAAGTFATDGSLLAKQIEVSTDGSGHH
jgi:hypothetical protein